MLNRKEIKYIQSLDDKKQRQKTGLFIAEGRKLVLELLDSHFKVNKIYFTSQEYVSNLFDKYPEVSWNPVSDKEMERVSFQKTPSGMLALVEMGENTLSSLSDNQPVLVLDGIRNPGNLGTIIRIADWFGINQLIASPDCVDCFNPKVVQSSMGSISRVHLFYTDPGSFLKASDRPVYASLLQGENLFTLKPEPRWALVIGNESVGIRTEILPDRAKPVTIPGRGGAESLNAAVATGIFVSQLLNVH